MCRPSSRIWAYGLLLLSAGLAFGLNLGGPSLWDVDEGRNAGCAYEMFLAGNYLKPTFNAELRVDKPPLLYWLQIIAYGLWGVNETTARLPSALAASLTLLVIYELGRLLFDAASGLLAGLVAATTPLFLAAARFANPDALLCLSTVLALAGFVRGYGRRQQVAFVPIALALAMGMLAKGPVGVVLPAGVIGLFLLWERRFRLLLHPRLLLGLAAFCVPALPWYLLVGIETKGEFLRGFFLTHNVCRFCQTFEHHHGGPWYYVVVLLVGFAPWSAFWGLAGWDAWQTCRPAPPSSSPAAGTLPPQSSYRLLFCWWAIYFLFFTLSATKLPNYILPGCPPLALALGRGLRRWSSGALRLPAVLVAGSLMGLVLTGVLTAVGLALAGGLAGSWLPQLPALPRLLPWSAVGLVPLAGAALAWYYERQRRPAAAVGALLTTAFLFLTPLAAGVPTLLNDRKPIRPLVTACGADHPEEDIRVGSYQLGHLPSLTFYCRRTICELADEEAVCDFLRWPLPVYLFLPEPVWQQLQPRLPVPCRLAGRHPDLYRRQPIVVLTNR
jgi:4-amino-4-deoxy-L-arabinose transferase-like glycosyltransferase